MDSHGCLNARAEEMHVCLKDSRSIARGFFWRIKPAYRENEASMLVQAHIRGDNIGITTYSGEQRKVYVSFWAQIINSSIAQIFSAIIVGVSAVSTIYANLRKRI